MTSPVPPPPAPASQPPVRVALVGARGFGAHHLVTLQRLVQGGRVELVGHADPVGPVAGAGSHYPDLTSLLADGARPEVVVIATPIHTHHALATEALRAGADVLLEKPPAASLTQFEDLLATAAETGRRVQVGFQSLGSHALPAVQELLASGRIGQLRAVSATGLWLRTRAYFGRSPWAGLRRLNGTDVVDGVATNPLAHAVATALAVAGARTTEDVDDVAVELFHAHEGIESDDTSVVRVRTAEGIPVTCALTLVAPEQQEPWVTIEGTEGRAVLRYTLDVLEVTTAEGTTEERYDRTVLLEDLLDRRADGGELLVPLASTGAFTSVLEAVRTAPDPRPIDPGYVSWAGEGPEAHPVVAGIVELTERVTASQQGLADLGVPWALPEDGGPPPLELELAGRTVARVRGPEGVAPTSSPRPVLHPVRTLAGTVLTDHQPTDHVWHLGTGVAVQDVAGHNLWGGRTFTRADGRYVWRDDHGHVAATARELTPAGDRPGRLAEELDWIGADGAVLLRERRRWTWQLLPAPWEGRGWALRLEFTLTPAGEAPVELGSPGSNGRPGGGYGGFFWRLPPVTEADVVTEAARGEEGVHGTVAPWLALTARVHAPGWAVPPGTAGQDASLVLAAEDPDPWFVRLSGYPGVGRSLAWEEPVTASAAEPLTRRVQVAVLDGRVTADEAAEVVSLLPQTLGDPAGATT